jgi:acyl dehydratase
MRYLADFEVGQTFTAGPVEVKAEEIISFARSYDPQYFHTDPEAAEASFFKGLASSGWMTAALTMRMLVDSKVGISGGMIGSEVQLAWPRPTRPGDVLRVVTEVLEVIPSRSKPERGSLRIRTDTYNQNDELVQTMTSRVMCPAKVPVEA